MFSPENLMYLNLFVGTILAAFVAFREWFPEKVRRNVIVRYACKYLALVYLIIGNCLAFI